MSNRIDLTNKMFGRLKVIEYKYTKNKDTFWECVCICGNKVIKRGSNLRAKGPLSYKVFMNYIYQIKGERYE